MLQHLRKIVLFFMVSLLFVILGCPTTTTQPDGTTQNDGGNTEKVVQPLNCEKGTACFVVGDASVRACDVILKQSAAIQNPKVEFDPDTIGQFKHRSDRIALAFIMQKDSNLAAGKYAALIRVEGGVGSLEIAQATCYDRKGAKIEKPDVKLERP